MPKNLIAPVTRKIAEEAYYKLKTQSDKQEDLYMITVPVDPEDVSENAQVLGFVLRYPTKDQMRIITPLLTKGDLFGATDMVLANCLVDGADMLNEAWVVTACIQPVEQMLLGRSGRLQKK